MKLFFEKYVMKSIAESIIGRKGAAPGLPLSLKGLRYGDVVEIYNDGDVGEYIYMPLKNIKHMTGIALEYDCFVTWNNDAGIIDYWSSSGFKQRFPKHNNFDDVKITRYVTHINEWQSISGGDDIKKLFSKYNIPIKK